MKAIIKSIAFVAFSTIISFAQAQTIVCPASVVVKLKDLDANYNYGDPTVLVPQPYSLTVGTEEVLFNCDGDYYQETTKTWALFHNGNVDSCSQIIFIERNKFEDYTPPADTSLMSGDPYNISPDVTGYYGPVGHSFGTLSSTYNDLVISTGPSSAKVLRTWVLVDWCDTSTIEHNQIITIGAISGNTLSVVTPKGNPVNDYSFELLDQNGISLSSPNCTGNIVEQINCIYESNPGVSFIELQMSNEGSVLNGVSTLDIVLSQKHILGITPFDNQYQNIAADVNSTNTVSALDLVEMKKLILGITTSFNNSPSWKFFNAINSADLIFEGAELPISDLNIIAVKIGDINCSAK